MKMVLKTNKKTNMAKKENAYKWEFENIGGTSRVRITSGNDIAHLGELDPTMWTVLSCPVNGLEIDEKSLDYIDSDSDGKIRVNDVVKTARWVCGALKDNDLILKGESGIDISEFNTGNESGKKLYDSACEILRNLGKEGSEITLGDTADITAIFAKTRFNGDGIITESTPDDAGEKAAIAAAIASFGSVPDRSGAPGVNKEIIEAFYNALTEYDKWNASVPEPVFGDSTDTALELYLALDAKVKDFFVRSRLAGFTPDNAAKLDIQGASIESISSGNLAVSTDRIAEYPLARITGKCEIDLGSPLNPAWSEKFRKLAGIAFKPETKAVTEEMWNGIGTSLAGYAGWKSAKAGCQVEHLGIDAVRNFIAQNKKEALMKLVAEDISLKEESDNIENVDKFLHIYRDFYRLLRNFITFDDFYSKDKSIKAVFQAGTLIIDERACRFCLLVNDMAKHNTMAAASGMFLVYCDCTTKSRADKITIAAAVTVGEIGDLSIGKNAVFYDNAGTEWDAVITKIIENPISISQAFWSPYRRMAVAIENLINKSAAEKDDKMMKNATEKINSAPASIPAQAGGEAKAAPMPFDIAKFAGIFAAIGMAFGMIGSALASLLKGFKALTWWQVILVFVCLLLAISGPAMVMAWMKLRRRNIAPLLNANGWAINASAKISIAFGATLTDIAKFPKLKLKDPYAKKGISPWATILITVLVLAAAFAALWYFGLLSWAGL